LFKCAVYKYTYLLTYVLTYLKDISVLLFISRLLIGRTAYDVDRSYNSLFRPKISMPVMMMMMVVVVVQVVVMVMVVIIEHTGKKVRWQNATASLHKLNAYRTRSAGTPQTSAGIMPPPGE